MCARARACVCFNYRLYTMQNSTHDIHRRNLDPFEWVIDYGFIPTAWQTTVVQPFSLSVWMLTEDRTIADQTAFIVVFKMMGLNLIIRMNESVVRRWHIPLRRQILTWNSWFQSVKKSHPLLHFLNMTAYLVFLYNMYTDFEWRLDISYCNLFYHFRSIKEPDGNVKIKCTIAHAYLFLIYRSLLLTYFLLTAHVFKHGKSKAL